MGEVLRDRKVKVCQKSSEERKMEKGFVLYVEVMIKREKEELTFFRGGQSEAYRDVIHREMARRDHWPGRSTEIIFV